MHKYLGKGVRKQENITDMAIAANTANTDQKRENLLNLSLSVSEEERMRSESLETGFDREERTWELIVKYFGDLSGLRERGIRVRELLNGYGILKVPEYLVDFVTNLPEIEYIEKPKRLFFAVNQARAASCLLDVQQGIGGETANSNPLENIFGMDGGTVTERVSAEAKLPTDLTGKGVLIAIIDSGIDYLHPDFQNPDGTSRILYLWDQDRDIVYTKEEINEALSAYREGSGGRNRAAALQIVPSADTSGHGTAVSAIAAGNGRGSSGLYRGVAYESELMVVKLGIPLADNFPKTTQLMEAVDFVLRTARQLGRPVAVNLSFGNTYGSHDGTSLLETFLDDMTGYGRNVIVAGTGNEGAGAGHTGGLLEMGREQVIELSVSAFENSFGVQLWKSYADIFSISLRSPSGAIMGTLQENLEKQRFRSENTEILSYYGKPSPYSMAQEVYFDFIPTGDYIDSGIWQFILTPERIITGQFDLWLPSKAALNNDTRFLKSTPETTLTIPSTARKVISAGAYDFHTRAYADFSGRGFTRQTNQIKPDVVAPGVNIITAGNRGGYEAVTGTSFATPFVTGAAALLMQWGIINGNDPFLYGEKVKAYLIRGARHLPGYDIWPNERLGYGSLCVSESLPLGNGREG